MLANKLMSALSGGAEDKLYVDDVFSAYTYTGNGSTQTINNGIDLAGKGGLVWARARDSASGGHFLSDTVRGINNVLSSNGTSGNSAATYYTGVTSSGFGLSSNAVLNGTGGAGFGTSYISWTFRKAPKFFDVVTWTGNGANRTIPHALGQEVGMMLVKRTDADTNWQVYHRSLANTEYMVLNSTTVKATGATRWDSTRPTTSVFRLGTDASVNASGGTYVAYIFAHDASADGIIQCGSFTTDGSGNATVNLGWEPQYVMLKTSVIVDGWSVLDSMRGWVSSNGTGTDNSLAPNTSAVESGVNGPVQPRATGFEAIGASASRTYIYLAIRRPNKPPTTGTQVFDMRGRANSVILNGLLGHDLVIQKGAWTSGGTSYVQDRLRGFSKEDKSNTAPYLSMDSTSAESLVTAASFYRMGLQVLGPSTSNMFWAFKRAPGFMDVVCYTGTGGDKAVAHSLEVAPEFIICKSRTLGNAWQCALQFAPTTYTGIQLQSSDAGSKDTAYANNWSAQPTALNFYVGAGINSPGETRVAYLFASLPGISKVGSYTGNGTTQTISCGFTTGARFILIKRTDGTGDWYVWDSVRGIVAGNDPHLSLNTTAAEVTTDDSVDPDVSGFIVNQVAATNINVSGGQYIFLAIA